MEKKYSAASSKPLKQNKTGRRENAGKLGSESCYVHALSKEAVLKYITNKTAAEKIKLLEENIPEFARNHIRNRNN